MSIAAFGGILAIALALAALLPFVRGEQVKATRDLLRQELEIEQAARVAQEIRCNEQIADLRGQVKVLTHQFATVIASEVGRVVAHDQRLSALESRPPRRSTDPPDFDATSG